MQINDIKVENEKQKIIVRQPITKACYQRGSGVLGQCGSFIYLWGIRTGNGFDSPRRIASLSR
jgi:hypothetical protein